MTPPKWIVNNQALLNQVRLDRFPLPILKITSEQKWSRRGFGRNEWLQTIQLQFSVREAATGDQAILQTQFDLRPDQELKSELLKHLVFVLDHEARETLQIENETGHREIPFDPH